MFIKCDCHDVLYMKWNIQFIASGVIILAASKPVISLFGFFKERKMLVGERTPCLF